jgi:Protein of unknown function (DUF2911)
MKRTGLLSVLIALLLSCNSGKEKENVAPDSTNNREPKPVLTNADIQNPYVTIDVSPMDMTYYPVEYPKLKMANATSSPPLARVIYSRPHLQGRHVFHEVLKYGEPWRMGANESTELELFSDATILDKRIKAGRYVMYCIPQQKEWTIILNSNIDSWGLHPDTTKDVARFIVPVKTVETSLEYFTIVFQETQAAGELLIAWDNVEVHLPISF